MSISGIGAAGSANAELAILLSKLRGAGETASVGQSAALPALSGQPETTSGTAEALSGTGKAALSSQSLAYLTMMQADDGTSVAAANTDTFTSSVNNNSLWDLVNRWSLGSNTFSTISKNITIATVIAENMPSATPEVSGTTETAGLNASSVPAVDVSGATNATGSGVTGADQTGLTINAQSVAPTTEATEQAAAMASVLGSLLNGYNPQAALGNMVDISG